MTDASRALPGDLPGCKKKSFSLPYGGGEIWFEHLDGMYGHGDLVLEKLRNDRPRFSRPSATSLICFVLDETQLTPEIVSAIVDALTNTQKLFLKVCFITSDKKATHTLRSALKNRPFALAFMEDVEKAKEWLIHF